MVQDKCRKTLIKLDYCLKVFTISKIDHETLCYVIYIYILIIQIIKKQLKVFYGFDAIFWLCLWFIIKNNVILDSGIYTI